MHEASTIVVLDDDVDRIAEMKRCLGDFLTRYGFVSFDNAPEMIEWLTGHLAEAAIISLDHDLGPDRKCLGRIYNPGTGRDVADYLAGRAPSCSVLIHTTNRLAAPGMEQVLADAGWHRDRVVPNEDMEWVQEGWLAKVRALLQRAQ